MKGAPKAEFSFSNYKISFFSFSEPAVDHPDIDVEFNPSGTYLESEGRFILTLEFKATTGQESNHELLRTILEATFKFSEPISFESIPSYFYGNAIAIVFPYLRAFVSTLTTLAMVKPMILPTLNLTGLQEVFKTNTNVLRNYNNSK